MADAHAHPTLVLFNVVDPVWRDFAKERVYEIVTTDFFGVLFCTQLSASILEITDQLFLFRVHRYCRIAGLNLAADALVDVLELRVCESIS